LEDENPEDELLIEDVDTVELLSPEFSEDTESTDSTADELSGNTEELNDSFEAQPFLQSDDQLSFDTIEEDVFNDNSSTSSSPAISTSNAAVTSFPERQVEEYVASTGPDTLVLTVTADSWIEIFDTNSQRVYFDLGRRGDRLTLYGTAPFEILLGFAQGVSIEFNGDPIEQAPFTRSGVARFTLGE
jgi:cytoskeleton protein RodZ